MLTVAVTDYTFPDLSMEEGILEPLGATVVGSQAHTAAAVAEAVGEADAVITQFAPVDATAIKAMKKARVIVRYGIGYDNVDVAAAKAKGIPVCNVPDFCIDEVADHTLALILALTRQIIPNAQIVRDGEWRLGAPLDRMCSLRDLRIGVIGFGHIGRGVVKRLLAFGGEVFVYDPAVRAAAMIPGCGVAATLEEVIGTSDLITLHCPSTLQTRGMLDAGTFTRMKPGVMIVNVSRGDLIVTDALIAALLSGQVGSAALDVTNPEPLPADSRLRSLPQAIVHSHIAAASEKAVRRLRASAADLAARVLRGEKPLNVVNGL
jgi:D-3-phosphoglycerate dehydrogenase